LYSLYYNETRTHLGLDKDGPLRVRTASSLRADMIFRKDTVPGVGSTLAPSLIRVTVGDLEVHCPRLRVTAATSSDHSCLAVSCSKLRKRRHGDEPNSAAWRIE
jgi:hypothetical protein